jgi:hypothetical protein
MRLLTSFEDVVKGAGCLVAEGVELVLKALQEPVHQGVAFNDLAKLRLDACERGVAELAYLVTLRWSHSGLCKGARK